MDVATTELSASDLAERHRLGLDDLDEGWLGVLHVVPAPHDDHSLVAADLYALLHPLARAAGLACRFVFGLHRPHVPGYRDHRVSDLSSFHPDHSTERGTEGRAELVIEIASPGDEPYEKVPSYGEFGVHELMIIRRDSRSITHWSREAAGSFIETPPDADGWHHLDPIPLSLGGRDGELMVRTPEGVHHL